MIDNVYAVPVSPYIYAMHDENPVIGDMGWTVISEELGHNPPGNFGKDYSKDPSVKLVRLNHGYFPHGTVPVPACLEGFVHNVRSFVANSNGCQHWIIGNEMNCRIERPYDMEVSPEYYAEVYSKCREAIHSLGDHEVIFGAVGPWNVESGDWLQWFVKSLEAARDVDAIALHTYTHGTDPELVFSDETMDSPYQSRYYNFRAYKDFIKNIPIQLKGIPLYITETNGDAPWKNDRTGWIYNAYKEINDYNQSHPDWSIRCLALYRYLQAGDDPKYLVGKNAPLQELQVAIRQKYTWISEEEPPPEKENPPIDKWMSQLEVLQQDMRKYLT